MARQERMGLENTAATLASELVTLHKDEDMARSPGHLTNAVGAEAHKNIIERHANRLEESRRLASVREMRDTLANSALEAVLLDEISDVEREIREMHAQRTKLASQLQDLSGQKEQLSMDIERQMKELGVMQASVHSLEQKKSEMSSISSLSAMPLKAESDTDVSARVTEEISLLDATISQVRQNSDAVQDQGDREYISGLLSVLSNRREQLFVNLPKDAGNDEEYVKQLERKLSEQNKQLEELRQAVSSPGSPGPST
eukprot:TRINITY_DN19642_c0_g1_i2.p1 TRINITY_DN19642_c0_g1~~TRINITY_DN19642_c0_g1_i2.p1  ORF type:complete len:258 (-),score=76.32 TRINITY_DN19642_c0_g1_i2:451-1224(-)